MSKIKILIVEDELIVAEHMKLLLNELNYHVIGIAKDISEAKNLLIQKLPDIAMVDIRLWGDDDGIQLAKDIKHTFQIPVIFVSSNSDVATVERAKEVQPDGYIVKPFEKQDLYTSIEIALSNFLKSKSAEPEKENDNYFFKEYLFVKKRYQFVKVRIQDIQWVKSDGNYLEITCSDDKKYLIRSTFKEFFQSIARDIFIQVHKSYAVNFEHIDSVRGNRIVINRITIPIGKSYLEDVRKNLNIIN